jgi:hypothetical protein
MQEREDDEDRDLDADQPEKNVTHDASSYLAV